MNSLKEQLQERAQLVRIHEANCNIEYPTPAEANPKSEGRNPNSLRRATIRKPKSEI
jgi:hypothetical protein